MLTINLTIPSAKTPCIYAIVNKDNGEIYVGSTTNILSRLNQHISKLINNKHLSPALQSDYNKGMSFEIKVLKTFDHPVSVRDLITWEEHYAEDLKANYGWQKGNKFNPAMINRINEKQKQIKIGRIKSSKKGIDNDIA